MINHGRTLLLNQDGASRPEPTFFLEELVPPDFVAQKLPGYLKTIQDVLLGVSADDAFMNYRLWQYMRLIHSTEFAFYLNTLDSRITYLTDRSVVEQQATQDSAPINPAAQDVPVFFIGSTVVDAAAPRIQKTWEVEVTSGLLVTTQDLHTKDTNETAVMIDSGLTSPIPLAGQADFALRIQSDPLPLGARWLVQAFAQPDADVTDLLEPLSNLGDAVLIRLFSNTEPYKTFKELWEKHFHVHYRLTGIILAWIYRAEEARTRGG